MAIDRDYFHKLLKMAVLNDVSDIHLRTNERPFFRIKGDLKSIKADPLSEEDMLELCKILIQDEEILNNLDNICEFDGSYQFAKVCRVRVNFFKFQNKVAFILRVINMEIPTLEKLKLPKGVKYITEARRGLVLVTGVTGSGKSSTLAAMLEEINLNREEHILTIEDPVEFLFVSKKCRISQRELGSDTKSFKDALRGALRQDPDIIVIGELRDPETIQIAMKAAETGHLVFGTVHTTNALTTINRVVSMFPPEEQLTVQKRLGDCLQATISQRLLPTKDGSGRVVAQEIMVNNPGVKECIQGASPLSEIYISIENGKKEGLMFSFDQHLTELFLDGKIDYDIAKMAASSPTNFERNLQFGNQDEDEDEDDSGESKKGQKATKAKLNIPNQEEQEELVLDVKKEDKVS